MSHIVRDTTFGTIDIVVNEHRVFFQQRWLYQWNVAAGQPAWTRTQRQEFHAQVDRDTWRSWSNRVTLRATGDHEVADGRDWPINLDVRWVTARGHFTVVVTKVAPGTSPTSSVDWRARRIRLDTGDFRTRSACTTATPTTPQVCRPGFRTVPHEVGHSFGNTSVLSRGDEYVASSAHLADSASIMNIGTELRQRHFRTILGEMNRMISGVTWRVLRIRN
ncbi:MAG: hypothetical protein H8E44_18735 [Planctomycetes bacterium]|nr:hypothetical protein [Planctomycetota bacterium]MBL7043938.1 hypothetical protein [Pirellulaceae bacterium]